MTENKNTETAPLPYSSLDSASDTVCIFVHVSLYLRVQPLYLSGSWLGNGSACVLM